MKLKIPLIRRKSLISAGVPNSRLINFSQRVDYFINRIGETSFFTPYDVLLIFIALQLFNFLPLRNINKVLNELVQSRRNLYLSLRENSKQILVIEKRVDIENYFTYVFDPSHLKEFLEADFDLIFILGLEKIYLQVGNIFLKKGLSIDE